MANILVVDDERLISSGLERVLKRAGHTVVTANNGIEAIKIVKEKSVSGQYFDFVFLDFLMPELSGAEVLLFVKGESPKTIVYMMTAYGDHNVKNELVQKGAHTVLMKPFEDITKIPLLLTNEH